VIASLTKHRAGMLTGGVLVAVLAMAGCSGSTSSAPSASASSHGGNIALLLPDTVTARWESQDRPVFEAGVKAACPKCKLTIYNAKASSESQLSQAEAAVTNGATVLVIVPVDTSAASAMVDRIKQTPGVSVISYGRVIPSAKVDYAVTTDTFVIGAQQAQSLVDVLHAKGITSGGLIVENGAPTDSFAPIYKAGAHSVLDKSGFTTAAEYDTQGWSADVAQTQTEQAITKLGKNGFVGIYAANDSLAAGAIAAMKGAGIDPSSRPTTGQDATAAGLQLILAGEQSSTIYQPIKVFAAKAADLAVALANGKKPPTGLINGKAKWAGGDTPAYLYNAQVITSKNIADTVVPKGFWTVKDICTPAYQAACTTAGIK
jgi:D-xylose transport system substrate-binding protein